MFYPTAVLAIQYPVQLTYQHGSATPDTSSRLPATRFLPPLHIQLTFFHPRLTNSQTSRHATTGTAKSIRLAIHARGSKRPPPRHIHTLAMRTFQSSDILPGMFTRNENITTSYRPKAQFPVKRPTSTCAATAQSAWKERVLYPLRLLYPISLPKRITITLIDSSSSTLSVSFWIW